jgi:peptidoglycan/xylan/chitin deacetylase (PgdA/CDA1 family)
MLSAILAAGDGANRLLQSESRFLEMRLSRMRLVSPLLKRAVYPTLHRTGYLRWVTPLRGHSVINYHGVLPSNYASAEPFLDGNLVRVSALREQLQYLKSQYHVLDPEEFRFCLEQGKPVPSRSVLITCDDGLLNTLTDMLQVLREEEVQCLFFVTTASCNAAQQMLWYEEVYLLLRNCSWSAEAVRMLPREEMESFKHSFQSGWWNVVRRASQMTAETRAAWMDDVRKECGNVGPASEERWRLLNARELRELAHAGMSIGAHTRTHPVLSLSDEEEARREIRDCKNELEQMLGRPVWALAYPFGNPATMGDREFRLAREAGYVCAFLNVEQWPGQETNLHALPRTHVTSDMTLAELAAHLSGVHARLQRVVGR